ncbi:MAG: MazG family protein [Coprococcus sp.]
MRTYNGKVYIENEKHDINDLLEIVAILRNPEYGCSWDKKQTHTSLKKCLTDETEEVIAAIDNNDSDNLCEELGDLLLQIVFHADISADAGEFDLSDVIQTISDKMIRRHPHIFGDADRPKTQEESKARWQEIKRKEKMRKNEEN